MKLGKTPCSECFFTNNHYFPRDFRDQMVIHFKKTYRPGEGALACHRASGIGFSEKERIGCRGFYDHIMLPALRAGDKFHITKIVDLNKLPKPEKRYISLTWRNQEWQYDTYNKEFVWKDTIED